MIQNLLVNVTEDEYQEFKDITQICDESDSSNPLLKYERNIQRFSNIDKDELDHTNNLKNVDISELLEPNNSKSLCQDKCLPSKMKFHFQMIFGTLFDFYF